MKYRFALSCLSLIGALAAPVAHAQDSAPALPPGAPTPRPAQPERQGPEIDVFRDPAPGTPIPAPTVPPPAIAPTVTLPAPVPDGPAPQPVSTVPRRPVPAAPTPVARQVAPVAAQPADVAPVATPAPAGQPPAPPPLSPSPAPARTTPWGWIAAAVALLLGGIGAWLFLRPARARTADDEVAAPDAQMPASPPVRPNAPSTSRAHIAISLDIDSARLTFAGAAITYRLTLHNQGDAPAQNILVHALLGSADAEQRELLQRFYSESTGAEVHSVAEIAPDQFLVLKGEIRMTGDAIVPVTIADHPLLIPLLAFDVHYRWGGTDSRSGRTGAAFIIGQEQEPPTARLAPFRVDLGPRTIRRPAVRAAGEPLTA